MMPRVDAGDGLLQSSAWSRQALRTIHTAGSSATTPIGAPPIHSERCPGELRKQTLVSTLPSNHRGNSVLTCCGDDGSWVEAISGRP